MLPATVSKKFINGLPKAELHLHLEGTLEPELKLALAQKNKIDIGQHTIEEIKKSYQFDSLSSFLNIYYPAMNVLQEEDDFYQLAMAYLKKARAHNTRYAELFFDPQAHTSRGIPFATVLNGYARAVADGQRRLGIESALIMCFLRDMSPESAEKTLQAALPYKNKIVGVGLDSDERNNPPIKFKKVFQQAKSQGWHITMHCDIDQQNSIDHIEQALYEIGVERLDHGTNIVENPVLVEYIREKGIGLTCCPVSNSFVIDDMKGNEIISLLRDNIKVTINSDDPAYFQSYISDNYLTLSKTYSLNAADIVQLAKNSFAIAWIPPEQKKCYLAEIDRYVENYQE